MADEPEPRTGRAPVAAAQERAPGGELHLYFPIEVEVRTAEAAAADVDAAVERAVGRLATAIRGAR
jgi:hypothetical protein